MIPNLIGNIPLAIIKKIANKHNLKIIEDSADTLGAKINGKSTGIYDFSITSFMDLIINCAGNGGMLMLNNKKVINFNIKKLGRLSSTLKN